MRLAIINRFNTKYIDYDEVIGKEHECVIFSSNKDMQPSRFKKNKIYYYNGMEKNFYLDICKEHKLKKFDRIVSTSEFDVERAAELRDYLKIPGISYDEAIVFRDKFLMKKTFSSVIETPFFSKINKWTDILYFIEQHNFPVIIKPLSEAGSDNINIIKNKKDLTIFYKKSLNIQNMIIEKFLNLKMIHMDGFYHDGKIEGLIINNYINNPASFLKNNFVGSIIENSKKIYSLYKQQVIEIFKSLKTKNIFPFHAEFFVNKNKIVLCEIGIRMGGGNIREIYKLKTSKDFLKIDVLSQIHFSLPKIHVNEKIFAFILIPNKKGTIKSIKTSEEYYVKNKFVNQNLIGKKLDNPETWSDFYVSYIVEGKNKKDVLINSKKLYKWQIENTVWEK